MIVSEVLATKESWYNIKLVSLQCFAAILLLIGYNFGYKSTNNIWSVTAASIATIVIAEPIIVWALYKTLPSFWTSISLILSIISIIIIILQE